MRYYNDYLQTDDELAHYGVLGMKWGVRRYQKTNGTLTSAGKKRYQNPDGTLTNAGKRKQAKRNRKAKRLESSVSSLSAENKLRKAELDDLNARGVKSPVYREAYIKALDTAYRHDPTSKHIYLNSDRILNSEKQYRSSTINANNRIIDKNKKLIENVKNTPLNDKTAFDKSRPYHVANIGALGISTALGAYGGTKLGNVYAGAAAGFMGGAAGVLLSGMGDKSRPEYWIEDKK